MKCINCGSEVPEDANVCGYCGHKLKSIPAQTPQPPATYTPRPQVQTASSPQPSPVSNAGIWLSLLLWALPTTFMVYIRDIASDYMFHSSLGGTEIRAFWNIGELSGQAVNALIMVGVPCAIAGYLAARNRYLLFWAVGGLLLLFVPFFIAGLFFMGISVAHADSHPIANFVSTWNFIGGFGPLIAALTGMIARKVVR